MACTSKSWRFPSIRGSSAANFIRNSNRSRWRRIRYSPRSLAPPRKIARSAEPQRRAPARLLLEFPPLHRTNKLTLHLRQEPADGEGGEDEFGEPAEGVSDDVEGMHLDEEGVGDEQRDGRDHPHEQGEAERGGVAVDAEDDAGVNECGARDKAEDYGPKYRAIFAGLVARLVAPDLGVSHILLVEKVAAEKPVGERGKKPRNKHRERDTA